MVASKLSDQIKIQDHQYKMVEQPTSSSKNSTFLFKDGGKKQRKKN